MARHAPGNGAEAGSAAVPHKHRRRRRRPAPASAPGSLAIDPEAPKPHLRLVHYGPEHADERAAGSTAEIPALLARPGITWIDLIGLGDAATLEAIGELLGLHPLTVSDLAHPHQRPKIEPFERYLYFVTRMHRVETDPAAGREPEPEQLSIVLGRNWVLSVQERDGDCFDPVRARIRAGKGRVRGQGPDYLAYLLLDAVVDQFFPLLDQLSDRIELLEDEVFERIDPQVPARIHGLRRELFGLRRSVWPQRDAINTLLRDEFPQVRPETRIYFRDVYDHCVQIIDTVDTHRELAQGTLDVYLSAMSNRMNEVMKVLTIIATIFIPLTFIVGVYGMNFDADVSPWNMPELRWHYGYPASLALMAAVSGGMLLYFWRRGWLGSGRR
jgi:magnesium transporter